MPRTVSIRQREQRFNPDPLSPGTPSLFLKAGTYECLLNSISYSKNSKKINYRRVLGDVFLLDFEISSIIKTHCLNLGKSIYLSVLRFYTCKIDLIIIM